MITVKMTAVLPRVFLFGQLYRTYGANVLQSLAYLDSGDKEKASSSLKALKKYNDSLAKYGIPYPVNNVFGTKSSEVYDKDMAKMAGAGYKAGDKEFKKNTGSARPKNVALHSNINQRTNLARYDARNEAALILIEALNTLLNE